MPDVTRSDSQKSDTSLRPRVSFNRDVHVKRIVPREGGRVTGAVSGDGAGHLVTSPVRKERLNKSKKELAEEAARVLQEADNHTCVTQDKGVLPEKFYTLPRKTRKADTFTSLDRKVVRRNSISDEPPKKPPRTFATVSSPQPSSKTSIFDVFKKNDKKNDTKRSNIKRSVSDATHLKKKRQISNDLPLLRERTSNESQDIPKSTVNNKKQLSPIIEDSQRSDYFSEAKTENKENIDDSQNKSPTRKKWKKEESVTEQLKQYIDEVDEVLYKETGKRITSEREVKKPEVIIIDVDKAEKISKNKKSRFKDSVLGKKLRSISKKGSKINDSKKAKKASVKYSKQITPIEELEKIVRVDSKSSVKPQADPKTFSASPAPKIKEAIESLENHSKRSPIMIHSSQQPPEKPPLTKGQTVDTMVRRLAKDNSSSPPPKTNILITPSVSMQHNNNQPFSYTRGLSPDKCTSNETSPNPGSPIIYAQVICGNGSNGPMKQTVHTAYPNGKKHPQHSDSDEGLGYEENLGFGSRKFTSERTMTHFGDDRFDISRNDSFGRDDYLKDRDKFEEETPITPKFRNTSYMNGFTNYDKKYDSSYTRTQHKVVDSSSRGRGDGMDSKRRESLTEPFDERYTPTKMNGLTNVRSDLSARRDLLESRINRRLNDKNMRLSPEYVPQSTPTNVFVSETKSKYYKSGSTSPIGYREKYISESKIDKHGVSNKIESRSKEYIGGIDEHQKRLSYGGYENEPKSFDSQISDYRSSPENRIYETSHNKPTNNRYVNKTEKQKIFKDRDYYRSNPEIHNQYYRDTRYEESYHDSLRREKHENKVNLSSKFKSERFLDQSESERKDKFGDSGIENDFKRDSGETYRVHRPANKPEYCNDSEDEGFASSLLIASERQHTEENFNQRKKRTDYDSDRAYSREDDPYRNIETMEYRTSRSRQEYIPRERSIDDGSHYDPRIDKDVDRSTLKRLEKKPPKPEKKSGLEKVKQLFSRDKKKKEKEMVREESLRARYTEYKGGQDEVDATPVRKKEVTKIETSNDYKNRRRLATPSPSPTRDTQPNGKTENTHSSWFKSLDRLSRKKTKKDEKDSSFRSTENEPTPKSSPAKNLRFFGDTDIESNDSVRYKSKYRNGVINRDHARSQSTRDLHNISEESRNPNVNVHRNAHKSMQNLSESDREVKNSMSHMNMKPPISPNHRTGREVRPKDERARRRKNEVSSVESSTEGDSSQQSQRSIVYLHAATVGDIPGPGYLRNGRRAASREELASNGSSRIQPQVKTLSRSFSVLAPWRPRHRDNMDIDYTQYQKPSKNGKYEQKVIKNGSSRKENSSTLKKKAQETRRSNQSMSTLNRQSKSKENLSSQALRRSREEISRGSTSTLYKKKERLPRENSRYNNRDEKKMSAKSMSVESLGSGRSGRKSREDVSRSISMPRDPEKSAGWFKMNRKSKSKSGSTQRL